jgi:hypothetical protein
MSEMIERVANAMFGPLPGKHPSPTAREQCIAFRHDNARRVIAAMREPNLRMIAAGQAIDGDEIDVWKAMNDAALAP